MLKELHLNPSITSCNHALKFIYLIKSIMNIIIKIISQSTVIIKKIISLSLSFSFSQFEPPPLTLSNPPCSQMISPLYGSFRTVCSLQRNRRCANVESFRFSNSEKVSWFRRSYTPARAATYTTKYDQKLKSTHNVKH